MKKPGEGIAQIINNSQTDAKKQKRLSKWLITGQAVLFILVSYLLLAR